MDEMSITRAADESASGYERVFGFIREQLLNGRLRIGDRLLPERELALKLGVSRPVIREVLRALAAMGIIEIRHGHGSVVRQPDFAQFSEMFTLMLSQHADAVEDIMQARIAIERQAIRLACERATLADTDRLEAAIGAIAATVSDPLAGGEADFSFHTALVEAAHSPTLSSLYAAISTLLKRSHLERRARINSLEGIDRYLIDHHREVLAALSQRDADSADRLLMHHFAIGSDIQRRAR
jgi:GntR family transcriptional regulator, transcriptional repressor for pyruvate dehydrogenase complex